MSSFRVGVSSAIVAQVMWGLFPVYWKLLAHVTSLEVLLQRNIWCAAFLGAFVLAIKSRRSIVFSVLQNAKECFRHAMSASLIAGNWMVYIWAVVNGHVISASLGYFLSPLFSVMLGVVFFAERPTSRQWIALLLAAVGVFIMIILTGSVPWIGLSLAATFGLYGMARKLAPTGPINGLFIESLLLVPLAGMGLVWLHFQGTLVFTQTMGKTEILLVLGGLITAIPLVLYAQGARALPLSLSGLLVYITPTIQFLIGWLVYREAMSWGTWFGFGCIWLALIIYSSDIISRRKGLEKSGKR